LIAFERYEQKGKRLHLTHRTVDSASFWTGWAI
jgi:hypothetical protein